MGKFDLSADEMKKFDLTAEENAPKSKYPAPKSFSQSDEQLGLETGLTRKRGILEPGFPGTTEDAIGAEMRKHVDDVKAQALKDFAKEVGAQSAGGALTAGIGAGINPKVVTNAIAPNALSNFAKSGDSSFIKAFLDYAAKKALGEEAANIAARNMGKVIPAAKSLGEAAIPAAGNVAGQAAGKALTADTANEPKPFKGVMSNAIDRLRVAAQTDQRAKELLGRIDAQGAGAETVTQGTLGSQ